MPARINRIVAYMSVKFVYLLVKDKKLVVGYLLVYSLSYGVTLTFGHLDYQHLNFTVKAYDIVLFTGVSFFKVCCQSVYIVILIFHEQEQAVTDNIRSAGLFDNWWLFPTFPHNRRNYTSSFRQFAIIACNGFDNSIVFNNFPIFGFHAVYYANTVDYPMAVTTVAGTQQQIQEEQSQAT